MKHTYELLILLLFVFSSSTFLVAQAPGGGVTDIDGNSYPTTIYGSVEIMAENLKNIIQLK